MTDYWTNAYGSPEKLGLEIIGEAGDPGLCYEFNMFIVWQDKDGKLYSASDSGCSCPSPFENYTTIEALGAPVSVQDIHRELSEWSGSDAGRIESAAELCRTLMMIENAGGGTRDVAAASGAAAA